MIALMSSSMMMSTKFQFITLLYFFLECPTVPNIFGDVKRFLLLGNVYCMVVVLATYFTTKKTKRYSTGVGPFSCSPWRGCATTSG